jgi:hypothetical protein
MKGPPKRRFTTCVIVKFALFRIIDLLGNELCETKGLESYLSQLTSKNADPTVTSDLRLSEVSTRFFINLLKTGAAMGYCGGADSGVGAPTLRHLTGRTNSRNYQYV